jgi:hypothetical protein
MTYARHSCEANSNGRQQLVGRSPLDYIGDMGASATRSRPLRGCAILLTLSASCAVSLWVVQMKSAIALLGKRRQADSKVERDRLAAFLGINYCHLLQRFQLYYYFLSSFPPRRLPAEPL